MSSGSIIALVLEKQNAIADLRKSPPLWVVLEPFSSYAVMKVWPGSDPSRIPMEAMHAYLQSHYRAVEPVDGKFGEFAYETGANGCPIISDAPASVECEVVGFYELGDHSTVVGKVTEGHLKREVKIMMLSETGFNYGG